MSAPLRQEWFSAAELAGLPGMSAHRETIIRVAARRGWQSREIPVAGARGVGLEFHISSLPPETQAELARRAALLEHPAALTAAYRAGSELAEALRPTTARATTSPVSSDQQPVKPKTTPYSVMTYFSSFRHICPSTYTYFLDLTSA